MNNKNTKKLTKISNPDIKYITKTYFLETYNSQHLGTYDDETIEYYIQWASQIIYNLKSNPVWDFDSAPEWSKQLVQYATAVLTEHWLKKSNNLSRGTVSGTVGSIEFMSANGIEVESVPKLVLDCLTRAQFRIGIGSDLDDDGLGDIDTYSPVFETGEELNTISIKDDGEDEVNLLSENVIISMLESVGGMNGDFQFGSGEYITDIYLDGTSGTIYETDVIDGKFDLVNANLISLNNNKAEKTNVYTKLESDAQVSSLTSAINTNKTGISTNKAAIVAQNLVNNQQNDNINTLSNQLASINDVIDNTSETIETNLSNTTYPIILTKGVERPFSWYPKTGENVNINGNTFFIKKDIATLEFSIKLNLTTTGSQIIDLYYVVNGSEKITISNPMNIGIGSEGEYLFLYTLSDLKEGDVIQTSYKLRSGVGDTTLNENASLTLNAYGQIGNTIINNSSEITDDSLTNPLLGLNPWKTQIDDNQVKIAVLEAADIITNNNIDEVKNEKVAISQSITLTEGIRTNEIHTLKNDAFDTYISFDTYGYEDDDNNTTNLSLRIGSFDNLNQIIVKSTNSENSDVTYVPTDINSVATKHYVDEAIETNGSGANFIQQLYDHQFEVGTVHPFRTDPNTTIPDGIVAKWDEIISTEGGAMLYGDGDGVGTETNGETQKHTHYIFSGGGESDSYSPDGTIPRTFDVGNNVSYQLKADTTLPEADAGVTSEYGTSVMNKAGGVYTGMKPWKRSE